MNLIPVHAADIFSLPNPLLPSWSVTPCIQLEDRPITSLSGLADVSSFSIGSGANVAEAEGTFTICDQIRATTPIATVIELPVHIAGGVLAAEVDGDPEMTRAVARLSLQATIAGVVLGPETVEVESETIFPNEDSINLTMTIPISVSAGETVFDVTIQGESFASATAMCIGFFCTVAGSAIAHVDFPNTIEIGNFTGPGGGPLPSKLRIESVLTGMPYRVPLSELCPDDLNADGVVNIDDFVLFGPCMQGPGASNPACDPAILTHADSDSDGDLDLIDFAVFQLTFGGACP